MDPPGALSQAAVDPVPPNAGRQINLPLPAARVEDGRNNKLLPYGELVEDDEASGVGRVEHPQRTYNRQAGVEGLVRVFLQQGGHRFLPQAGQPLRDLEHGIVRVLAR